MTNFSNMWNQSNCLSKGQLIGYIRQTLDRDEVYLVESHLNDCQICSDALDGLMEEDLDIAQQDISQIKSVIETKINQIQEIKPPVFTASKSKPAQAVLKANKTSSNRNRWMIAASIIGAISLGGLTVYSYLKSHDAQLVKNESLGKGEDVEYNKPSNPNANEITTIKVMPPENESISDEPISNEEKKSVSPKELKKDDSPRKENAQPTITPYSAPKAMTEDSKLDQNIPDLPAYEPAKSVAKDELKSNTESIREKVVEPSPTNSNYYTDTKKPDVQVAQVAKKKGPGMSSGKQMPAAQNAKELSYSSNSNNQQNESESSKDERLNSIPVDEYSEAMESYNQGNYKESIRHFENALKNSSGTKKEDIQYHLALAYEKTGKDKKAKRLFEELALGTKYKREASEKLIKLTK